MHKELLKWVTAGMVAVALAVTGCTNSSPHASVAKPSARAENYPAPEVEVYAQPMLASYDQQVAMNGTAPDEEQYLPDESKPTKKHSRHHSHHKKVESTASVDADMGYMAADDPKLLEAQIAKKEKAQKVEWKDWVAPGDSGPEGH